MKKENNIIDIVTLGSNIVDTAEKSFISPAPTALIIYNKYNTAIGVIPLIRNTVIPGGPLVIIKYINPNQ